MSPDAWYLELIAQGYTPERARARAWPKPVALPPLAPDPWWNSEDSIYESLGTPLELAYGPRE